MAKKQTKTKDKQNKKPKTPKIQTLHAFEFDTCIKYIFDFQLILQILSSVMRDQNEMPIKFTRDGKCFWICVFIYF